MKRYLKLGSALLAIIGVVLMFATQVTVKWFSGHQEAIGVQALVGGKFHFAGGLTSDISNPCGVGLAGYILLGVGALFILLSALVPFFKEHDMLSMVITGLGVVCIVIGVIMIFLIRKNFADNNGPFDTVYVGWGAIAAGSLGSIAGLGGVIGMIMDLTGTN